MFFKLVVNCKSSDEDTIVSKAYANKPIEVKSKSINVVEPEEKPEVTLVHSTRQVVSITPNSAH